MILYMVKSLNKGVIQVYGEGHMQGELKGSSPHWAVKTALYTGKHGLFTFNLTFNSCVVTLKNAEIMQPRLFAQIKCVHQQMKCTRQQRGKGVKRK